jgi:hypothetical protein
MTAPVGAPRRFAVLESCRQVAAVASSVRIDEPAVERLADRLTVEPPAPPGWPPPHVGAAEAGAEGAAGWTLLLSALNFSFWEDEPRWRVASVDGYLALATALRRAYDAGVAVADPRYYASWNVADLAEVLRGDPGGASVPPLLAERHAVATELGAWLVAHHGGSALRPLQRATSAAAFAQTLAATLPRFRDVADYRGMRVALLKRAQIAAYDCGQALGDAAPAGLRDRSGLCAFADYKLPQVLRGDGVLVYAKPLAAAVDERQPLAPGSEAEVEIRALTVVAVDEVVEAARRLGLACDATSVDAWLWWRGQQLVDPLPYHRTRTIWY